MNAQPIPLSAANPALASSEALSFVLLQAMEKQPEKRQQSVEQLGEDLLEAFKRDTIRSNYLKNRKGALLSSSSTDMPAYNSADDDVVVTQKLAKKNIDAQPAEPKGFIGKLMGAITGHKEVPMPADETPTESKINFLNCPRCNDPCEPGISFCLNCGRSLATTHEFAKIRAASGVFALPKSSEASSSMPVFSAKARDANAPLMQKLKIGASILVVLGGLGIAWHSGAFNNVADTIGHMVHH